MNKYGVKKIGSQKIWVKIMLVTETNFVYENFGATKIVVKKILAQKKSWVQNILVSKKC